MDQFIVVTERKSTSYKPAMIDLHTYERLVQVKESTGVGISRLIEQAVTFALDRLEIRGEV